MGRDQIPSSSTPTIINKILTTAGNEESQDLGATSDVSVKKIQIKSRTSDDLKFSWESGGDYITIPAGQTYWDDGLDSWNLTLYLVPTIDGQVAEIQVWK